MPTYEYQCEKCEFRFEVQQSIHDEPVTECRRDGCGGPVRRVFSPPAIIFKGSGFYVTDYGRGNSNTRESATKPTASDKNSSTTDTD